MREGRILNDQTLIGIYRLRIETDPKSKLFLPLAVLYRKLGRSEEAVRLCLRGLEIYPHYHSARVNLALAYLDQGNVEEASSHLERALRSSPENLLAREALAQTYLQRGQVEEAIREYKLLQQLAPLCPRYGPKLRELQAFETGSEEETLCELKPEEIDLEEIPVEAGGITADPPSNFSGAPADQKTQDLPQTDRGGSPMPAPAPKTPEEAVS